MKAILRSTARSLWRHWPAMLAWYLGGIAVHYVIIQVAGVVGAHSATVGFLILPIAILARLISYVAMFLVLRDGLSELGLLAPLPDSARERRRTFLTALLAGILPFLAIYWGQGLLGKDVVAYTARSLRERSDVVWTSSLEPGQMLDDSDTVANLPLSVWTVLIIVIAFAARWAWTKWQQRIPGWVSPIAVYLEVVWVFFSVMVIGDLTDSIKGWIDSRVAMSWLEQVRESVLGAIAPLQWAWDGILWVIGEAGPILLAPLAWLTVGGVVYGQAIVAEKIRVENELIDSIRERAAAVPNPIMRRLKDLGDELGSRFVPIGRALLLMWRAGPVLIASYALLHVCVKTLETYAQLGITRLVGPHDMLVWTILLPLVSLVPVLLFEPLRICVIAGAYDTTLRQLRIRQHKRADAGDLSAEEADVRAVADAAGLLPDAVLEAGRTPVGAAPAAEADEGSAASQGSIENRANRSSPKGSTSTQNGPSTSSGMTNPTVIE